MGEKVSVDEGEDGRADDWERVAGGGGSELVRERMYGRMDGNNGYYKN